MSASRYLCAIALLLVTLGALPKPQPGGAAWTDTQIARLHENVDAALEAPALQGAYVGLLAIDTVRGTVLVLHHGKQEHFGDKIKGINLYYAISGSLTVFRGCLSTKTLPATATPLSLICRQ